MKMYFPSLLLSSVFSLSALITAVYKSHESICGLVISRTPQSGDVLLLSLSPAFFNQEGRIKGKDHQFVLLVCCSLYPSLSSPGRKK